MIERGYRVEPCACGGRLTALSGPLALADVAESVRDAVVLHQETPRHTSWADARFERARYGAEPTMDLPVGDLSRLAVLRSAASRSGAFDR